MDSNRMTGFETTTMLMYDLSLTIGVSFNFLSAKKFYHSKCFFILFCRTVKKLISITYVWYEGLDMSKSRFIEIHIIYGRLSGFLDSQITLVQKQQITDVWSMIVLMCPFVCVCDMFTPRNVGVRSKPVSYLF